MPLKYIVGPVPLDAFTGALGKVQERQRNRNKTALNIYTKEKSTKQHQDKKKLDTKLVYDYYRSKTEKSNNTI